MKALLSNYLQSIKQKHLLCSKRLLYCSYSENRIIFKMSMPEQCSRAISSVQDLLGYETCVEHCMLRFTIQKLMTLLLTKEPQLLGKLTFPASENDQFFTLWLIELNSHSSETGEGIFQVSLTRLNSKNISKVFVRFCCDITYEGKKCFLANIHDHFRVGDKISRLLIETDSLFRSNLTISPNAKVNIFCDLTVFERNVEDYISSEINKDIPRGLKALSSDMDKLLQSEASADVSLTTDNEIASCHKAVLVSRSSVFSEWLENGVNEKCKIYLGDYKSGVLRALLKHIYSGINDFYLKHTIPTGLKELAEQLKLSDLRKHIDHVSSLNIAKLQCVDVTWKIYNFFIPLTQPYFGIFCPKSKSPTLFDQKWQIKLTLMQPDKYILIYILRHADKTSTDIVEFKVQAVKQGKVKLEKIAILPFSLNKQKGLIHFMTLEEIRNCLTEGNLTLRCSLKILESNENTPFSVEYSSLLPKAIDSFRTHSITNLKNLSENLMKLFVIERFSDAVIHTIIQDFRVHTCILTSRLRAPLSYIKSFLQRIDHRFVEPFINYLYSGDIPLQVYDRNRHIYKIMYDKMSPPEKNIMAKYLEFLTCNVGMDDRYHAPKSYRGDSIIINDTTTQFQSLTYHENASSEQSDVNRSSKTFDHNKTTTDNGGGKLKIEKSITLNAHKCTESDNPYAQEERRPFFAIDILCSTTNGCDSMLSFKPKYRGDLTAHQNTYEDLSLSLAKSCNIDTHHPTGDADCEDNKATDNIILQHPSMTDTANISCTSNENNNLPFGIIMLQFENMSYKYTIQKPL